MKKFWNWLMSFFGFGEGELTKKEKLDRLLEEIGSQEKLNECKKMAFQLIQKKDPIQPGKPHRRSPKKVNPALVVKIGYVLICLILIGMVGHFGGW